MRIWCAVAGGVAAEVADVDLNEFDVGSIVVAAGAVAYKFVVLPNRYRYSVVVVVADFVHSDLVDCQQVQMADRPLRALQD